MASLFTSVGRLKQSGIPIVTAAEAAAMSTDADLFFCCGTDPAAVAIHLVTGSPISHCGFLFREDAGLATVESTFTQGVHIGRALDYLQMGDGACIVARLEGMTAETAETLLKKADALIGTHYQVAEEIEMALHTIIPCMRVKPEWDELFCSGLIQDVLRGTEWAIPDDKDGGNATPVDVWSQPFVVPICAVVP
ncbi:MAG: hypothetical protein KGL39_47400 [Patescibacteria group bacterium]|nr:hypothetical protein [Patescibacteria group bacterium]